MKSIQEMLNRGFGMVPINELQSINYHDNTMFLVFAPATGFTDQSIYYEIEAGLMRRSSRRSTTILLNI